MERFSQRTRDGLAICGDRGAAFPGATEEDQRGAIPSGDEADRRGALQHALSRLRGARAEGLFAASREAGTGARDRGNEGWPRRNRAEDGWQHVAETQPFFGAGDLAPVYRETADA